MDSCLLLSAVEFPFDSRFVYAAPSTLVAARAGGAARAAARLKKILFLPHA